MIYKFLIQVISERWLIMWILSWSLTSLIINDMNTVCTALLIILDSGNRVSVANVKLKLQSLPFRSLAADNYTCDKELNLYCLH